jgi:hypothetical protein
MTLTVAGGHQAPARLTSIVRPAAAWTRRRPAGPLTTLVTSSDMVVVDLTATRVSAPGRLAVALRAPAQQLTGPDRCLLLVGAGPDLATELQRADDPAMLAETAGFPPSGPR